jgi:hypothetical protein
MNRDKKIIGVCGQPAIGKSTFARYMKDVLFAGRDTRLIQTGEIAKGLDKKLHDAGSLGPELPVRKTIRREILEGFSHGASNVVIDACPRTVGQLGFAHGMSMELGTDLVVCRMIGQGKLSKHDHLFDERTDSLVEQEKHLKRVRWWNGHYSRGGIRRELDLIMPYDVAFRVTYPNTATHIVQFFFTNEQSQQEWAEQSHSIFIRKQVNWARDKMGE